MHGCQTSYTNRAFNSLQFGVFYGIFKRTVYAGNEETNFPGKARLDLSKLSKIGHLFNL